MASYYIHTNVMMRIKPYHNYTISTSPLLRFIVPFLILTSPITSFCIPSSPFITRQTTTSTPPPPLTTTKASTQEPTLTPPNDFPPTPPIIPITTLSGFLGAGKTTVLTHILHNTKLKIALIVNDVAKINIDSKLISSVASSGNVINLSNGCACCSLSDDLLSSVSELVTLSDLKGDDGEGFDCIVVECSGVSEPKGIRNVFQEGELYGMPLMERVRLDTMVTVVDCGSFLGYLRSDKKLTPDESPELLHTLPPPPPELNHLPPHILSALDYATPDLPSHSPAEGVSSLLISQIETADVLILNKRDLLTNDERYDQMVSILAALNPRASVFSATQGCVDVDEVLNARGGEGVAMAGMVDDHRESVVRVVEHAHDHDHAPERDRDHAPARHDRGHGDNHSHDHNHETSSPCHDPECTDTSHSHTHSHSSIEHHSFIESFVYTARKPFHPRRLSKLLSHLPVTLGLPSAPEKDDVKDAMKGLLRSKGFCWLGCSDVAAMYWSHAGSAFEMQCWGRWWATLDRKHWPEDAIETILSDFDSPTTSSTVGDRRQEIVFIGTELDRELFQKLFDDCLLTDEEYSLYQKLKGEGDERLKEEFGNGGFDVKMVTY